VRLKHLGDGIHPFGELGWIEDNRRVVGVAWSLEGRGECGESRVEEQLGNRVQ
jgi:hypothetical protein